MQRNSYISVVQPMYGKRRQVIIANQNRLQDCQRTLERRKQESYGGSPAQSHQSPCLQTKFFHVGRHCLGEEGRTFEHLPTDGKRPPLSKDQQRQVYVGFVLTEDGSHEKLSSAYDIAMTFVSSKHPWLPTQGSHMTEAIDVQSHEAQLIKTQRQILGFNPKI